MPGTTILSSAVNANFSDIATGLSDCATLDTQAPITGNLLLSSTGYMQLPSGTSVQRPASGATAYFRFNTTLGQPEYFANSTWNSVQQVWPTVSITNSLGSDVALNNTSNFFDGPSVAQGTSGIWFAFGTVTLIDTGVASFTAKLWDGTTVIASAYTLNTSGNATTLSISGVITSPAGNLRVSVKDNSSTAGKILFNQSGLSKDSTITAIRIG